MVKKYKTPFTKTLFEKTIDDILVPPDLAEYVHQGANVHRYKFHEGDFEHIFDDRVDEHTKRMVLYAEYLPLSPADKSAVIRTLWIHDIPEIMDSQAAWSDMTAVDKARQPHLAYAVKEREQAIIESIFSYEDKELYRAFDPAKEMLYSGKIDYDKTTPVGMVARVLDNFVDGTNSFHGFVTDYLGGDEYRASLTLPGRDSFEYCFQKGLDVYRHVSALDHPDYQDAREMMLQILENDFFGFVEKVWSPLAIARLPDYARAEYDRFAQEVPKVLQKK